MDLRPALLLAALAAATSAQDGFQPTAVLLAHTADLDRSGDLVAEERAAFLDSLPTTAEERVDVADLKVRFLVRLLDVDGDPSVTREALEPRFGLRDRDGDGRVSEEELGQPWSADDGGAGRATTAPAGLGFDELMFEEIVLRAADTDGADGVSGEEWRAFLEGVQDHAGGGAGREVIRAWIENAQRLSFEDRNAFTPDVYLLTLDSELDASTDGVLTRGDLDAVLSSLDADSDGALSVLELTPPPQPAEAPAGGFQTREATIRDARTRPPLVKWQRKLSDALALVERTGKPLLVAVNMDGEVASESLAWGRYRDPEFAELTEGFIPVIASPDRHASRDHDDLGRRLPDPRFGRVVDSEHIALEPIVFERYFEGRRVAPRHVGVAPDGTILFDLFLLQDLSAIDRALAEHGVTGGSLPPASELDAEALLDSHDAGHRAALESGFATADATTRTTLASLALSATRETQHPELVRMALRDEEASVRLAAVQAISSRPSAVPIEMLDEAFRVAYGDAVQLRALIDAAHRRASELTDEQAKATLRSRARAFAALQLGSDLIDVPSWRLALGRASDAPEPPAAEEDRDALFAELAAIDERRSTEGGPALQILFAATAFRAAQVELLAGGNPSFLFADAREAARAASAAGGPRPRALAWEAAASHQLGDADSAARAAAAALPQLLADPGDPVVAHALRALSWARRNALFGAMNTGVEWPATWLADLASAGEVLLEHPSCSADDVLRHLELLGAVNAFAPQGAAARRGVERFPTSGELHNWLRFIVLRDGGARALEATYASLAFAPEHVATVSWWAGYASLIAAERNVEEGRENDAIAAYDRSALLFRECESKEPSYAETSQHHRCLALSGASRVHANAGRLDPAVAAIRAAVEVRPESMSAEDGLGITPVATAWSLVDALESAARPEEAQALRDLLEGSGIDAPDDER